MTEPKRRSPVDQCDALAGKVGDGACDATLVEVCRANNAGTPIAIWDLPKLTGLPLHEAFAAVRTLEFGKLVNVIDNPSDPFGALLELREDGVLRIMTRRDRA